VVGLVRERFEGLGIAEASSEMTAQRGAGMAFVAVVVPDK
jgi:hypothetical protein